MIRRELGALGLSIVVLALVAQVPGWAPVPPPPPAPVVVLAVDGFTWPQLAPLVQRGALAGIAAHGQLQHAAVLPSGDVPFDQLWLSLDLKRHVEDCGRPAARFAWPITGDLTPGELVVLPPGAGPLPPALAERLGRDLGTSRAVVKRLGEKPAPALLLAHFEGPLDPGQPLPGAPLPPLVPAYATLFAGALDRAAAAAPAGSTVILVGLGTGRPGLPDGQGAWLAAGPRLRAGALAEALRASELAPTILELAGLPLPSTLQGGAAARTLITPPFPVNRRITWLSPR